MYIIFKSKDYNVISINTHLLPNQIFVISETSDVIILPNLNKYDITLHIYSIYVLIYIVLYCIVLYCIVLYYVCSYLYCYFHGW